jgi:hypothetical protein
MIGINVALWAAMRHWKFEDTQDLEPYGGVV